MFWPAVYIILLYRVLVIFIRTRICYDSHISSNRLVQSSRCPCWFSLSRSWMKKRDHSASPRPRPSKTKIQTMLDPACAGNQVIINGHSVEVVESFPYLGSLIHCIGDSAPEIKRRVSITRECTMALDRNIWRSRISVGAKLRLYNSCILSIFLYGAEAWAVTATAAKTFDAIDQWCLCRILNVHWTECITNNEH